MRELAVAADRSRRALEEPDDGRLHRGIERVIALPRRKVLLRAVPFHRRAVGDHAGVERDQGVRYLERGCRQRAAIALVAAHDGFRRAIERRDDDAFSGG
jgi:hypothetical protein